MNIRLALSFGLIILLLLGGSYYYFLYPPVVMERSVQKALDSFGAAIASEDRSTISAHLKKFLTNDAHIRLEVTYVKVFQQNNPSIVQLFDTPELFITFIDNILYSMQDYAFSADIRQFELSPDKKTASLSFHSNAWADGNSSFDGTTVRLHFVTDTTCTGHVVFDAKEVKLRDATCILQLGTLPKDSDDKNLQNPAVLKEIMR